MGQYLKNFLLGLDQWANTILRGSPDETLSARAYRLKWKSRHLINLMFWDRNHCKDSYYAELNREHLPEDYRKPDEGRK